MPYARNQKRGCRCRRCRLPRRHRRWPRASRRRSQERRSRRCRRPDRHRTSRRGCRRADRCRRCRLCNHCRRRSRRSRCSSPRLARSRSHPWPGRTSRSCRRCCRCRLPESHSDTPRSPRGRSPPRRRRSRCRRRYPWSSRSRSAYARSPLLHRWLSDHTYRWCRPRHHHRSVVARPSGTRHPHKPPARRSIDHCRTALAYPHTRHPGTHPQACRRCRRRMRSHCPCSGSSTRRLIYCRRRRRGTDRAQGT